MKKLNFKYKYGFAMPSHAKSTVDKGINESIVREISRSKKEEAWILDFRLRSLRIFEKLKNPSFGPNLEEINFQDFTYYLKPTESKVQSWHDLPVEIRKTYDRIGIREAERDFLSGVSAQYDSEVVYEKVKSVLSRQGVVFCDIHEGLAKYKDIASDLFGTLVGPSDNKYAALNSACFSGGSFVYVPPGVKVSLPLQAYFRINSKSFGQFERTLIVVGEGADVTYIEGCTAPIYKPKSLHAAVVEIFVHRNAKCRYTTVQNWSANIYNLVTKRATTAAHARMEWVDCNIGSCVTMKYPSVHLKGEGSHGEVLSIAYAARSQHQDTGSRMLHLAPHTSSRVVSKSICRDGGITSYRGKVYVAPTAHNCKVYVSCDAMIFDDKSTTNTYPVMDINNREVEVQHEATVSRIGEETLTYLMSRGIEKPQAEGLLVNGFVSTVSREIPFEYAIELNRLLALEMEGSVG